MKPYKFHPEALEEVDETVFFYENKQTGLGDRFLKILEETIAIDFQIINLGRQSEEVV